MKEIEYHFYRFTLSYYDRNITSIGSENFWNRYQSEALFTLTRRTIQYNLQNTAGAYRLFGTMEDDAWTISI